MRKLSILTLAVLMTLCFGTSGFAGGFEDDDMFFDDDFAGFFMLKKIFGFDDDKDVKRDFGNFKDRRDFDDFKDKRDFKDFRDRD